MIDDDDNEEAFEKRGGIGGKGGQGGEEFGALSQGGDHHRPGQAAIGTPLQSPWEGEGETLAISADGGGGQSCADFCHWPSPSAFPATSARSCAKGSAAASSQWITVPWRSIRRNQVS